MAGVLRDRYRARCGRQQSLDVLIRESLSGSVSLNDVVGPVGLISVVHEASYNGIGNVMKLAAFISANLAIINLIPIPALDGGRLVVVIGEAIARRKSPQLLLQIVNTLGIALIIHIDGCCDVARHRAVALIAPQSRFSKKENVRSARSPAAKRGHVET